MPFIDKSTLTYPATNAFPVRKWLDTRNPVSGANGDFKNFRVFDVWINEANQTAYIMVDRTVNSGTWLTMATTGTGILTITGSSGGAVGADGADNINLAGDTNVTVVGDPGNNKLTVTLGGAVAASFPTDAGTATPAAGALSILGTGGTTTSGAGSTVTVTSGPTVPTSFVSDSGTAIPALNILNILGGTGASTTGATDTITVNVDGTVATTFTCDAGSATPAANNLNVIGSGSTTTSGAGSTVTILSSGGGISWNQVTVVGPTTMAVDNGYVANSASRVQLLLPDIAPFGSVLEILGKGSGGWQLNQNAGETVLLVDATTTLGLTDAIQSSESGATIRLVCITADLVWRITSSTGNLIFN